MDALCGKNVELPATKTFIDSLRDQFDEQKKLIIAALAKCRKVCTTSDVWSKGGKSFLGVTAHYIDEHTLQRYSFLLAFRRFIGRSTYDVLGKLMYDIHNEFGLNIDKLTHTVTDGGSNYCKAFKIFGQETETLFQTENDSDDDDVQVHAESTEEEDNNEDVHVDDNVVAYEIDMNRLQSDTDELDAEENSNEFESREVIVGPNNIMLPKQMRCGTHKLNNVTSRDFEKNLPNNTKKALRKCLRKLRRVWGLVRRSTLARGIVERLCGRMLVIPNDTRWNALYDACKVVLSLRDKVSKQLFISKLEF